LTCFLVTVTNGYYSTACLVVLGLHYWDADSPALLVTPNSAPLASHCQVKSGVVCFADCSRFLPAIFCG